MLPIIFNLSSPHWTKGGTIWKHNDNICCHSQRNIINSAKRSTSLILCYDGMFPGCRFLWWIMWSILSLHFQLPGFMHSVSLTHHYIYSLCKFRRICVYFISTFHLSILLVNFLVFSHLRFIHPHCPHSSFNNSFFAAVVSLFHQKKSMSLQNVLYHVLLMRYSSHYVDNGRRHCHHLRCQRERWCILFYPRARESLDKFYSRQKIRCCMSNSGTISMSWIRTRWLLRFPYKECVSLWCNMSHPRYCKRKTKVWRPHLSWM